MENKSIDLSVFANISDQLVGKNLNSWLDTFGQSWTEKRHTYKSEEIVEILNSSNLVSQQKLSRTFFDTNGLYKRILYYYGTLLCYAGLLIPNPSFGKKLSKTHIAKKYHQALLYLSKVDVREILTRMSMRALVYGSYYGIIKQMDKEALIVFDLPPEYCRSNYRDVYGNDIVEFNVRYFETIYDEEMRLEALRTYPKQVVSHYKKYKKGKVITPWVKLPTDVGICITFFDDNRPLFIDIIPQILQYEQSVVIEQERALEEIRKIIIQKIPHLTDGQLLFEPPEALTMHQGTVKMLSSNPNISVLTTYADVDSVVSKAANDDITKSLDQMLKNVYASAGVGADLFAPSGSQALPISIQNDMALMMILGNKYSRFFTHILNELYANINVQFTFTILPLSYYNQRDFLDSTLKLAQAGYSFLLPALASGLDQRSLVDVKDLENNLLKLNEVLQPLSTSFNSSVADSKKSNDKEKEEDETQKTPKSEEGEQVKVIQDDEGGRPPKDPIEQSDQTIKNKEAQNNN